MSIDTAGHILDGTIIACDVCVIGSGAAGITVAHQLNGTGLRVIVLEGGGIKRDESAEADSWSIDYHGEPQRNPNPARGRWFGGSTNLWFGRIAAPDPTDFEPRAWVPHSGWPLTLEDVRPWLTTAAAILDVPNFDKITIDNWAANPTIQTFVNEGGADLGVFLWAKDPFMGPRYRSLLKASSNVRLLLQATATELVPNEGSTAIESVAVRGPDGNRFTVTASTFVLAAGGLENPRLLLASTRRSPAGVGNGEDQVGRYYMDHPRGEGLAQVDLRGLTQAQVQRLELLGERTRSPYGPVQLRVKFPAAMQQREGLLNHSLHGHLRSQEHDLAGYQVAARLRRRLTDPRTVSAVGLRDDLGAVVRAGPELALIAARKLGGRVRPTELVVIDQMEQEPDPESRVTVNPRHRDRFGLPRLELDWRIGASTYRSQRRMHQFFQEILERVGIRSFTSEVADRPDDQIELWDMKHPSGTTRMAASPRAGVVDADCRVHGVANLFVTGSSVFPTVGHANPTLLIVALAARLAQQIRRGEEQRGGNLRLLAARPSTSRIRPITT